MTNELKPCPFCGREPKLEYNENCGWQVYCSNVYCAVETSTYYRPTRQEAIKAWNARAEVKHD